jgi:putative transposase
MAPPPRIPNWLPFNVETIYFVTFCVAHRQPVLDNREAFAVFQNAIARLAKWNVLAGLLMPDHVHVLAGPLDRNEKVGNLGGALKRWMRAELRSQREWQPGSFDRLLATESASQKWSYIWDNPVRAGLVKDAGDWPYQIGLG